MHRIAILLVLAGCMQSDDGAGAGPDCSAYSIELAAESSAIAVGGDERVAALIVDSCGGPGPHWGFAASSGDPAIATAHVDGDAVVLHAIAPGSTVVTVTSADGLTASLEPSTAVLDHVQLGSHEDGVPDAFLVGAPVADVNLLTADGAPLVDTSMTITGAPPGVGHNEVAIDGLAIGDHPLAITAGGQSWSATVHVVATIDEVVPHAASVTVPVSQTAWVCFDARLAGQVVAGAPWQFTFPPDHGASGGRPNCVSVLASAPTSFTVTATALGKSTSTQVTFVQ